MNPSQTTIIHQRGVGLVEIMIAMLLVGIMFNGLMEIFLSSRQTYNATDNARAASP